ncbi:hypothetical protein LOTGIDRAFT_163446, partial [Lottia gigantea]
VGSTALRMASQSGHVDIVNLLLAKSAEVNTQSQFDYTALLYASLRGHVDIVKTLLEIGADVNATNQEMSKSRGRLPDADLKTLQYFHVRLKTDLCPFPLADHLYQKGVIDEEELDIITTTKERSGRAAGVQKMLEILRFTGRRAFHLFLECLENKDVGYEELAKDLRKHKQTLLSV